MRLSKIQKNVLFLLYLIEHKGNTEPVPSIILFKMINSSGCAQIFDTNFRASCHKLHDNELVQKFRGQSLKLSWGLSSMGREKASIIFANKMEGKRI